MLPEGYDIEDLTADHAAALADAYRRNRVHLAPWEPTRDESFFTERGQEASVASQLTAMRGGLLACWVVINAGRVVGRVNLNNIVMGVFRSASVGYWVDAQHLGRGVATAATRFACDRAVDRGLHRVEGSTLLANTASQRVLERCGFDLYGVAPRYLFINGRWQDNRLYQRVLHDDPL